VAGEREKRLPRGSVQFTAFVKKAGITGVFELFLRVLREFSRTLWRRKWDWRRTLSGAKD